MDCNESREFDDLRDRLAKTEHERDAARAEVERWKNPTESHPVVQRLLAVTKERDEARTLAAQYKDDLKYMLDLVPHDAHREDLLRVGMIRIRVYGK